MQYEEINVMMYWLNILLNIIVGYEDATPIDVVKIRDHAFSRKVNSHALSCLYSMFPPNYHIKNGAYT